MIRSGIELGCCGSAFQGISRGLFRLERAIIPKGILPSGDAAFVVTAGAKPKHIVGIDVEKDGEKGFTGSPAWSTPAEKRRRVVVLRGLGDNLRPVLEEPPTAGRKPRWLSLRQQVMTQIDAPVVAHARVSERRRRGPPPLRSSACTSCRCRRDRDRCGRSWVRLARRVLAARPPSRRRCGLP